MHWQVRKKNSILKSKTLNILYFKTTVSYLSLLFCHSSSNWVSIPVHNQDCLLNSFFKISLYTCCPWSEVCMITSFPPHPFAYFRLFALNSWFLPIFRRFKLSGVDSIHTYVIERSIVGSQRLMWTLTQIHQKHNLQY